MICVPGSAFRRQEVASCVQALPGRPLGPGPSSAHARDCLSGVGPGQPRRSPQAAAVGCATAALCTCARLSAQLLTLCRSAATMGPQSAAVSCASAKPGAQASNPRSMVSTTAQCSCHHQLQLWGLPQESEWRWPSAVPTAGSAHAARAAEAAAAGGAAGRSRVRAGWFVLPAHRRGWPAHRREGDALTGQPPGRTGSQVRPPSLVGEACGAGL